MTLQALWAVLQVLMSREHDLSTPIQPLVLECELTCVTGPRPTQHNTCPTTLLQGQDYSDPFRRTLQRSQCAEANSGKWLPANITAPASLYQSLLQRTEKLTMVDIIGDATGRLKNK